MRHDLVRALVQEKIDDGDASSVSVYFRDLDNGNWFGIREDEKFSPVIQLKLPILIAYFKWSEDNPLVLRKKILFRGVGVTPAPLYLISPKPLEAAVGGGRRTLGGRPHIRADAGSRWSHADGSGPGAGSAGPPRATSEGA